MPRPEAVPDNSAVPNEERMGIALQYDLFAWREQLARSIARNNLALRSEGITTLVNQIILRILFLCFAEDRGFQSGDLVQRLSASENRYRALISATGILDDLWSDLAQQTDHPSGANDHLTEDLAIENSVMEKIFLRLISPERPYDFARLSLELVADVLEVYLRRTVRRSATHQAEIVYEHTTAVAGGNRVPRPEMTEYLVRETIRQSTANRSRKEILPLRIVDPACGPGRVLLIAFRYLVSSQFGSTSTSDERRAVVEDSLHGVDANRHAVTVARLLLALALCDSIPQTQTREHGDLAETIRDGAPSLRNAIRCGNPLIGPGIVHDESWAFCPARERHKLDPFAWVSAFPEIFTAGGFDAVICIPPMGPVDQKEWTQRYFQRHYAMFAPGAELSGYYVEQALFLLRAGGTLGHCMSDRFMRGRDGSPLRSLLVKKQLEEIVDLRASGDTRDDDGLCILRLTKTPPVHPFPVTVAGPGFLSNPAKYVAAHHFPVNPAALDAGGWSFRDTRVEALIAKISETGTPLEVVVMGQVHTGTGAGIDRLALIDEETRKELILHDPRAKKFIVPLISGVDIGRYRITSRRFAIIIPKGWTDAHHRTSGSPWRWFKQRHASVARLLKKTSGETVPGNREGHWWESSETGDLHDRRPSIFFPVQSRDPAFASCDGRVIPDETAGAVRSTSLYLLGLMNSRLIAFFLQNFPRRSVGPDIISRDAILTLPIYTPDLDDPTDRTRHDRMVALIHRMNDRQKKILDPPTDADLERLEREIQSIDSRINALVYELYGLTKEEADFVES